MAMKLETGGSLQYNTARSVNRIKIGGIDQMSSIEERVQKIVIEQLGVKEEEVTKDASFVDDLGADSLDTVELVMALEEECETEIPDEDAEKITTVTEAVNYINANCYSRCIVILIRTIILKSIVVRFFIFCHYKVTVNNEFKNK